MQMCRFLYIDRCWKSDQFRMGLMLDHLAKVSTEESGQSAVGGNYQLLIFPEGTNLTEKTRAKSNDYAAKTNQKPLKYLLHPRTTGFSYLAGQMRKSMVKVAFTGSTDFSRFSEFICKESTNKKHFLLTHIFLCVADNNLNAIYDVTIAYPDNLPETEVELAHGNIPSEIHFHIKR